MSSTHMKALRQISQVLKDKFSDLLKGCSNQPLGKGQNNVGHWSDRWPQTGYNKFWNWSFGSQSSPPLSSSIQEGPGEGVAADHYP
jgi:hypothetical protein